MVAYSIHDRDVEIGNAHSTRVAFTFRQGSVDNGCAYVSLRCTGKLKPILLKTDTVMHIYFSTE